MKRRHSAGDLKTANCEDPAQVADTDQGDHRTRRSTRRRKLDTEQSNSIDEAISIYIYIYSYVSDM